MPKSKDTYHHANLREELIKAACQIISANGVDGLTMRRLSQHLGVSRTAAYRHFDDKTALLFAVAESSFRQIADSFGELVSGTDRPPLEVLKGFGRSYVEFARGNPAIYRLMFGSKFIREKHPDSLLRTVDEAFGYLLKAVERCQEQGSIQKGSGLAITSILWASMHGLSRLLIDGQLRTEVNPSGFPVILTELREEPADSSDPLVEMMINVVVRGLAPE